VEPRGLDLGDLPDNSHKSREEAARESTDEKKIEKVIIGNAVKRKTPLGKRLRELIVGGDSHSVGRYILFEVLVPAFKDTITDVVSQGVERMVYGEARSTSRRTGQRPGGAGSSTYVNYSRFGSGSRNPDVRRPVSTRNRTSYDIGDIIVDTRGEADLVFQRMFDIINQYQAVTVADLYSLVGMTPTFTDQDWGWTDIRGAGATRINEGYVLELPKPEPLK
jgi:hypothetical protein